MHRASWRTAAAAACLLLVALGACGGDDQSEQVSAAASPAEVEAAGVRLPNVLLGLEVRVEDVSKQFQETKRPWIDNLGLFSLRENDLVRATLQVSRFNRAADPGSKEFRSAIIDNLGTVRPQEMRIGNTSAFLTTGNDQSIFVWFEGRGFFVLTTHRDYEFPRLLLRRLVELGGKL